MSMNMDNIFLHETRMLNGYIYVTAKDIRAKFVKLISIKF
jgi:hypothetical protein